MTTLAPTAAGIEILDNPASDPVLVRRMLGDIARVNRWLGGRAAVHHGLRQLLDPADRGARLTLLDLGTGAGDLPLDAVRWAARRGIIVTPLGLERIHAAATMAEHAGVPTALGCVSELPVRDGAVDIVLVSQVAHHFGGEQVARLFAECSRIARRGVIIADLRPSAFASATFPVAGALLGLHRATVQDGITSLARGFTTARMRTLIPPGTEARIFRRPIARIVACWRTDR